MTADMATELKPRGVAVVSLYPVAALAADPEVLRHTGKVLVRPPLCDRIRLHRPQWDDSAPADAGRCL